jgi:hypothetical protein
LAGALRQYVEMVAASPSPRRVKAPSWLDLRLILGVLLVLASVLAGAYLVSAAAHTDRVLGVTRDLSVGTILHAEDLTRVSVRLGGGALDRYVDADADVVGRQLTRAVAKGELLPATALRAAPALTTVTVPLAAGQAPRLAEGQRIELWLSTKLCPSVVLLPEAAVQAVHAADASALSVDAGQDVTLSLSPEQANRVVAALAIEDATVRGGVLSGPASTRALPDLTGCTRASTP